MSSLKTFGAIGGVVAIAACWPLAVGQLAQNQIEKQIANLDKSTVNVELLNYDRGYLSSDAQSLVTVVDPDLKQMLADSDIPTEFKLNHNISHGIWSVTSHNNFAMENPLPMELTSITKLTGNTDVHLTLDNYEQAFKDNSKVAFKPLTLDLQIEPKGDIAVQYESEGLSITLKADEQIETGHFEGSANGFRQGDFWIGDQLIDFEFVNLSSKEEGDTNIKGLNYQYKTNFENNDTLLTNQSIVKVNAFEHQGIEFSNLDLEFGLEKIDSQAFMKLLALMKKQSPTAEDSKQAVAYIDSLFQKGFEFGIERFNVEIGEGKVNSRIHAVIPENSPSPTNEPFKLATTMQLDTDNLISEEILTQFPELKPKFDKLIKLKMMDKTEQGYVLKGQLENGTMKFSNGTSMPYMMLAAGLL